MVFSSDAGRNEGFTGTDADQGAENIFTTDCVKFVDLKVEKKSSLWISRTTVNTLEDVSPEDVTTVILTRRVM